jgi:hypothetical protein
MRLLAGDIVAGGTAIAGDGYCAADEEIRPDLDPAVSGPFASCSAF